MKEQEGMRKRKAEKKNASNLQMFNSNSQYPKLLHRITPP